MDKDLSKRLFRAAGVPVPEWFLAPAQPEDISKTLGWPVIVKPSNGGSTIGLSLVRTAKANGRKLRLSSDLPAHARRLMEIVGLLPFVPIADDPPGGPATSPPS